MSALRIASIVAAALLVATPVYAAKALSEARAHKMAVQILKGDPYGRTDAEVDAHIQEARFLPLRDTVCHGGDTAAWAFHVVVSAREREPNSPINGWLVIDGHTGRFVCANLPLLD